MKNAEEENAPASSCNPTLEDDGDRETLRGDAIGNTVYSERFVLTSLLSLTKNLSPDEEFERDLCTLWDMTLEEDVVLLLLEHNVLDLFEHCIESTDNKRLTEILVGIMGNMSSASATRKQLLTKPKVIETILSLVGCSDTPTLIQLMRLLTTILLPEDPIATTKMWFTHFVSAEDFVPDVAFLLSNSINESLLQSAMQALNALLAKFAGIEELNGPNGQEPLGFSQLFLNEELIKGTIDAFLVLRLAGDDDEDDAQTKSTMKQVDVFLNIHCLLAQYSRNPKSGYSQHLSELMKAFDLILQPICDPCRQLPVDPFTNLVVESVNGICLALGYPFHEACLLKAINLWKRVSAVKGTKTPNSTHANSFEIDKNYEDHDMIIESLYESVLELAGRTIRIAEEDQLEIILKQCDFKELMQLMEASGTGGNCYSKLKTAFEKLDNPINKP